MRYLPLVIVMLFVSVRAFAADGGAIAAALKDEASECRYVLDLCRRSDAQLAAGNLDEHFRILDERWDALHVVVAKHGCAPRCFADCRGLAVEKFGELCSEATPVATPGAKRRKK